MQLGFGGDIRAEAMQEVNLPQKPQVETFRAMMPEAVWHLMGHLDVLCLALQLLEGNISCVIQV